MSGQNKVSGVVLAGGQARRMHHQDKGLILFKHQTMISYALTALTPVVDEVFISANRNQDQYRQFGFPVIGDQTQNFDGPLAGIHAAMQSAQHPVLMVVPCDSPLVQSQHLQRLLSALDNDAKLATAFDGERLHPVFLVIRTCLQADLKDYLLNGGRKLENWINRHQPVKVDYSDVPDIFVNINTFAELSKLEGSDK